MGLKEENPNAYPAFGIPPRKYHIKIPQNKALPKKKSPSSFDSGSTKSGKFSSGNKWFIKDWFANSQVSFNCKPLTTTQGLCHLTIRGDQVTPSPGPDLPLGRHHPHAPSSSFLNHPVTQPDPASPHNSSMSSQMPFLLPRMHFSTQKTPTYALRLLENGTTSVKPTEVPPAGPAILCVLPNITLNTVN